MSKSIPVKPSAPGDHKPRIGVYVCHCGLNIAQSVDCARVAHTVEHEDGVVVSKDIVYACSEPGQQQIKQDILDNDIDRVVIASCSPRLHEANLQKNGRIGGRQPLYDGHGQPARAVQLGAHEPTGRRHPQG
jgi:hypothetical protein